MDNWQSQLFLRWWNYQVDLVQAALSSLTFLVFFTLLTLNALPITLCNLLQDVFRWFNDVFSGVYLYSWTTYFSARLEPMCGSVLSPVYSHSPQIVLLEMERMLHQDTGTSKADLACSNVLVWRGRDKVVDVGIPGVWDPRLMELYWACHFRLWRRYPTCRWWHGRA